MLGTINGNEVSGIFGSYTSQIDENKKLAVGESKDIKTGNAVMRTVIKDNKVEDFTINILRIDDTNDTKNILFEITDERLLNETGGIVQGMSGSPIIQDNKIIGAVTHVIVNEPTKGYGIFITTMLKEGEN